MTESVSFYSFCDSQNVSELKFFEYASLFARITMKFFLFYCISRSLQNRNPKTHFLMGLVLPACSKVTKIIIAYEIADKKLSLIVLRESISEMVLDQTRSHGHSSSLNVLRKGSSIKTCYLDYYLYISTCQNDMT